MMTWKSDPGNVPTGSNGFNFFRTSEDSKKSLIFFSLLSAFDRIPTKKGALQYKSCRLVLCININKRWDFSKRKATYQQLSLPETTLPRTRSKALPPVAMWKWRPPQLVVLLPDPLPDHLDATCNPHLLSKPTNIV